MPSTDFTKIPKPNRKVTRTFTLKPSTIDLIAAVAERHSVSASRVVDIALTKYLTRVLDEGTA